LQDCQSRAWHPESAIAANHGNAAGTQPLLDISGDFSVHLYSGCVAKLRNHTTLSAIYAHLVDQRDEAQFSAHSARDNRSLSGRTTSIVEKCDAANGGLHEVPTWQCDLQKPAMRIYVKEILFSSLLFSVAVSYENIVFLSHSCDYTSAILCFSITNSVWISPDSQFDLYTPSLFDGFH